MTTTDRRESSIEVTAILSPSTLLMRSSVLLLVNTVKTDSYITVAGAPLAGRTGKRAESPRGAAARS